MANGMHVTHVIDVQLKAKLGIIGYKNQAARLISLCDKIQNCKIEFIYHPTKLIDEKKFTNDFSKLRDCDAIIIATPNHTHFGYIEKLLNGFDGYIFCEKPPVTSLDDIDSLDRLPLTAKEKIFFNFNYRFSRLNEMIKTHIKSTAVGNVISIRFLMAHGFAFKQEYLSSWRSNGTKNLHNILDTLSIHYLDLANFHFGKPSRITYYPSIMSKNGSSYDTSNLLIQYDDGKTVSILNSYASPLINEISVIGTNGVVMIRNNQITIHSPRDTFNEKQFFITPPIVFSQDYDIENEYTKSLENSLSYFISSTINKLPMDIQQFNTSLETNRLILQLHN